MLKNRYASWAGGTALGIAIAGAAVWAQPELKPDRAGETPVQLSESVQSFSKVFREVAQAVTPSVVSIEASTDGRRIEGQTQFRDRGIAPMLPPGLRDDPRFKEFFREFEEFEEFENVPERRFFVPPQHAKGSGVIIDSAGVILTNNHVVSGADEVMVRLSDGREFVATEILTDPRSDVAVVKIDAENLTPAAIGNSAQAQVGDWVLAIGSSFGLDTTVTAGIIGGKNRTPDINVREGFIQTDAAINPGNSGGPLVNLKGQVIGINTAISSRGGGFDGVGFSIPIDSAKWVAEQLLEHGAVHRSYLGVGIQPMSSSMAKQFGVNVHKGVLVNQVFDETPAAKAGLQVGDIIVSINGTAVTSPVQLQGLVERIKPGESAQFKVIRQDKPMTVGVEMAQMPGEFGRTAAKRTTPDDARDESDSYENLGLEVSPLEGEIADKLGLDASVKGVVVTRVEPGSPAADAGLDAGVVIERVGSTPIENVEDFRKAIEQLDEKAQSVLLLVRTPQGSLFLTLDLD